MEGVASSVEIKARAAFFIPRMGQPRYARSLAFLIVS